MSYVETGSCSAYEVIEVTPLDSSAFSIDDTCYPNEDVLYWPKDLLLYKYFLDNGTKFQPLPSRDGTQLKICSYIPMSLVFSTLVCYPVQHLQNSLSCSNHGHPYWILCGCSYLDRSNTMAISQFLVETLSKQNNKWLAVIDVLSKPLKKHMHCHFYYTHGENNGSKIIVIHQPSWCFCTSRSWDHLRPWPPPLIKQVMIRSSPLL